MEPFLGEAGGGGTLRPVGRVDPPARGLLTSSQHIEMVCQPAGWDSHHLLRCPLR